MDTRQAFEAWLYPPLRDPYKAKYEPFAAELAWAAWQAATERAAKVLDEQRYMTLEPLRTYTADEAWQIVRSSVKYLAAAIRAGT